MLLNKNKKKRGERESERGRRRTVGWGVPRVCAAGTCFGGGGCAGRAAEEYAAGERVVRGVPVGYAAEGTQRSEWRATCNA
jgi:hypothetical protein